MASNGRDHNHDALWAKLWELELQLAAYKLLHAARCEGEEEEGAGAREPAGAGSCCRGRQYDEYMRRRDARRAPVAAAEPLQAKGQQPTRLSGGYARPTPLTVKCAARDTPQVRRAPPAVPVTTTPRKEQGAVPLARSRTVSSGAPAAHQRRNSVGGDYATPRSQSHQRWNSVDYATPRSQSHQRRNSVGGECATPRPFLRRGTGTGGATALHLRSLRVHDLPTSSPSPSRPPQDHHTTKTAAGRHLRSVSELPFVATAAAMESPRWAETPATTQARVRKRWGSLESPPPAFFSAAATNPHMDLAKGLRKLLSFVRKSKSGERQNGGGRDSGARKPVKGWSQAAACSGLDGPFDRANLEGHRFPMTPAAGTSR